MNGTRIFIHRDLGAGRFKNKVKGKSPPISCLLCRIFPQVFPQENRHRADLQEPPLS